MVLARGLPCWERAYHGIMMCYPSFPNLFVVWDCLAPLSFLSCLVSKLDYIFELPHEKTNNVVFEQVQHKLVFTVTEDG